MTRRRPLPVGPLALALRHLARDRAGGAVVLLALVLAAALLAGAFLLPGMRH